MKPGRGARHIAHQVRFLTPPQRGAFLRLGSRQRPCDKENRSQRTAAEGGLAGKASRRATKRERRPFKREVVWVKIFSLWCSGFRQISIGGNHDGQ
jgi:hypothetical protein